MSAPTEAGQPTPSGSAEDENPTSQTTRSMLDVLPIPANQGPNDAHETANTMAEEPSLSHALAAADDHEEKGAVQEGTPFRGEVADLGWNEKKEDVVAPLVGGLDNEDLWLLVRRFNKQVYHVKEVPHQVPGNLDLNIADEEEFSPDKLRANVERLYMTVVIGLLNAVKHIARLRSWKETRRTSYFCAAYFIAWLFDFIMPLASLTMVILIVYPPARARLFPPAPIALVDSNTGGVQKPAAGVLGSHDSATGAPENHKGEAVEQEASNFFNGFTSVALTSATGKHPQAEPSPEETVVGDRLPDPTSLTVGAAEAKDLASGGRQSPKKDKTKVPVENTIWLKMRPVMHGIADVADTWERFGNALSPTSPFPKNVYRLRLAGLIAPLVLVSLFVTSYLFLKGATFGLGFAFFGDPLIARGLRFINQRFPHWQKILELRNTVLKGVPTNAQLTLTLLRIGEANKAPLPPPPRAVEAPPNHPAELTDAHLGLDATSGDDRPLDAHPEELRAAAQYDPSAVPHLTGDAEADAAKSGKHTPTKKGGRVLGLFKGAAKGAVKTVLGADHARAKTGVSHHARDRLGATMPAGDAKPPAGPVEFGARYGGRKGNLYIATEATVPAVGFSPEPTSSSIMNKLHSSSSESKEGEGGGGSDGGQSDLHPVWTIPVSDIRELKKIGGYGWKGRIVVGWSLGREINDGLEITDRRGKTVRLTAVPLRDELFNRLVAMGGQKWEAW